MRMDERQFMFFREQIRNVYENSPFYKKKFREIGLNPDDIVCQESIKKIPFTTKEELREAYPLGIQAVPDEGIVRIHSSSGTTGKPIIIPYTEKDTKDWAEMMARCFSLAGVGRKDRVQITPGYGLWTAGIGFQAGVEELGAMAIPTGPGNTFKQLQMMMDLKSTVFIGTSSYALVIAEEVQKQGLRDKINLKKGIIGSERWGDKMRGRIKDELGIELFDIYGLTEIYGPGIAIDCNKHEGMHYWDDFLYFEIIDADGNPVEDGVEGELVITTIRKQGAPLIRYRTHDLTKIISEKCSCGLDFPRIDRIKGRTDDMIKIKGVNIYPGQIDDILSSVSGASSEYKIEINHENGHDNMLLTFEREELCDPIDVQERVEKKFKTIIGIKVTVESVRLGELPRSEKKTKRVYDYREN